MKIQIEFTRPETLRLPRTRRMRALVAILAVAAVAVPSAWATHVFFDVPTSSPHHDDVTALRGAGITTGCNPPMNTLYCPADPVRRDQMASFLSRGLSRAAQSITVLDPSIEFSAGQSTDSIVASVSIVVPGTGMATQFVKVDATLTHFLSTGPAPAPLNMYIADTVCTSGNRSPFFTEMQRDVDDSTTSVSWVGPAPPGTRAFRLCAWTGTSDRITTASTVSMAATTAAFGSTGGAALSTEKATDARPTG